VFNFSGKFIKQLCLRKSLSRVHSVDFASGLRAKSETGADCVAAKFGRKIQNEIKNFSGKVWIYAKNLDTGKDYALRADEQVRTASTIKLPIMTEVFRQVAQGKIKWTDEIVLTKQVKQGGSGVLSNFPTTRKSI
jgi:beta-lactamase class A